MKFTNEKLEYVAALCQYQGQIDEVLQKLEAVSCLRNEGKALVNEVENVQKAIERELEPYFNGSLVLSASEHIEVLNVLGAGYKHGRTPFVWAANKDLISYVSSMRGSFTYIDLPVMFRNRSKCSDETPRPYKQ